LQNRDFKKILGKYFDLFNAQYIKLSKKAANSKKNQASHTGNESKNKNIFSEISFNNSETSSVISEIENN
jgi:hypothetical protein